MNPSFISTFLSFLLPFLSPSSFLLANMLPGTGIGHLAPLVDANNKRSVSDVARFEVYRPEHGYNLHLISTPGKQKHLRNAIAGIVQADYNSNEKHAEERRNHRKRRKEQQKRKKRTNTKRNLLFFSVMVLDIDMAQLKPGDKRLDQVADQMRMLKALGMRQLIILVNKVSCVTLFSMFFPSLFCRIKFPPVFSFLSAVLLSPLRWHQVLTLLLARWTQLLSEVSSMRRNSKSKCLAPFTN